MLMNLQSREYKYNRQAFDQKARSMTEKYAKAGAGKSSCSYQCTETKVDSTMVLALDLFDFYVLLVLDSLFFLLLLIAGRSSRIGPSIKPWCSGD